ncbi:TMhelix containing protein [Vibrio phage LP.2]|nr:TMhelix containing protein [Vibrio phage LP.2]
MNEQLQNALAAILGKTIEGIDASVEFMQAELPDVISQLLIWYGAKSAIMCTLGILAVLLSAIAWLKWVKHCKKDDEGYHDEFDMYMIPSVLCIVPAIFAAMSINLEWLQIWIAPKIWLIEYAASLTK